MTEDLKPTHNDTESSNIHPPVIEQSHETNSNVKGGVSLQPLQHTKDKPCECGSKEGCSCNANTDGGNMSDNTSYVYSIGRIQAQFTNQAVEKEFMQAIGRTETGGLTDRELLQSALSQRQNRYLARQMCWILTIEGLETYILVPRDPSDLDLLIESLRPAPRATDVDVVIGIRGPISNPQMCNGLMVPLVSVSQIYSFDIDSLIKSIQRPENIPAKQFNATVEDVFSRITQMADNAGATDEHRALNYLSVRYQTIYSQSAEMFGRDFSLTAIEVRPSPLSGIRKIVDVIFSYTNRNTDFTEKNFVRVDVTEEFPFLVTKMSPYYAR